MFPRDGRESDSGAAVFGRTGRSSLVADARAILRMPPGAEMLHQEGESGRRLLPLRRSTRKLRPPAATPAPTRPFGARTGRDSDGCRCWNHHTPWLPEDCAPVAPSIGCGEREPLLQCARAGGVGETLGSASAASAWVRALVAIVSHIARTSRSLRETSRSSPVGVIPPCARHRRVAAATLG